MKRTILILGLFVFGAVFFQSCKDDSLTAEEAKAGIDNADKELKSLVMSFEDGDAYATFKKFTDYSKRKIAKETNNEEWMDTLLDKLEEVIDFDQMQSEFENENRFYFDRYLGIYTWDIENKKWNKESSDHIELIFPSEENLDSNDIKFTFSSYSDENIILEGESYWAPVSLHAKIEQNGTLLASIDLNNIDFDTDLFYLYKQIDISLFVNPIKINYFYDNRSPVNFYTSFDISDGVNTVGTVIDLYTLHELSEDFTEQDFKDVSGKFFINNLEFRYYADIENIADYNDEPSDSQINSDINVDVYLDNEKIGYLLLENDQVYIVYNDNSRETFEDAFAESFDEMHNLFDSYAKNNKKAVRKQKRKLLKFLIFKTGGFKNLKRFIKYEHKMLSEK